MAVISLERLADRPNAVGPAARWIHEEWGGFSGRSLEQTLARFANESRSKGLPTTFVALDGAVPLGVASLRERDSVDWDPGREPWICNVYVTPQARGRGVAAQLCRRLEEVALEMNVATLFLASRVARDSVYERIGYVVYGSVDLHGAPMHLMKRHLRAAHVADSRDD